MAVTPKKDLYNKKFGKKGERQAVKFLKRKGYKILEKNFKNPFGEVDVIAKKDGAVAFIEVKTRTGDLYGTPSEAVGNSRKRRYVKAAEYYFKGRDIDCTVRFDVIEIYNGNVNHIENAFERR